MDPKISSKSSITVCESSSGSVLEAVIVTDVKGETSDSVPKHVLIEKQEEEQDETKPQQRIENDSITSKDGVRCSNVSAHAVGEEVADNVTAVSSHEAASVNDNVTALSSHDAASVKDNVTAVSSHDAASVKDNVTPVSSHKVASVIPENDTSSTKGKATEFHVVDLSFDGESDNGQRICRICHFGPDQSPDRVSGKSLSQDLIEIGCKCKNELGLAHSHCAQVWFKLRGNSVCEICGCTAKNVTLNLTEEEWNEVMNIRLDDRRRRGGGESCCIFMVFLLTIILLHWFFKKMSSYYRNK